MKYIKTILLSLIILFNITCTSNELQIEEYSTGNSFSSNGMIKDPSLLYNFKKYEKKGKIRDLFNYIYFEGDTICFHFRFNQEIKRKDIDVWFLKPDSKMMFPAERLDINNSDVYGFSLVGSLLDSFYKNRLDDPIPEKAFCCEDISFIIKIKYKDKEHIIKNSFKIRYKD